MEKINFDDIEMAYSGKKGCMCGCKGKYIYKNIKTERERTTYNENKKHRNDTMIKKVIRLMNEHSDVVKYETFHGVDCWYLEMMDTDKGTDRVYCIWTYEK